MSEDHGIGMVAGLAVSRAVRRRTRSRAFPGVRGIALANRAFLQRAVRFLAAEAGIRQFIDIGTGIPSAGWFRSSTRERT
jgi:S-adenosyl methyltransferase